VGEERVIEDRRPEGLAFTQYSGNGSGFLSDPRFAAFSSQDHRLPFAPPAFLSPACTARRGVQRTEDSNICGREAPGN
jgi:hypothetical protein